jgi:hypothetical protein
VVVASSADAESQQSNDPRRKLMLPKTLTAAALASLAFAATAAAAEAPTLGPVTIIKAGEKSPVAVAGNHLPPGGTIPKGTQLRRWPVTMHGASKAAVTLSCGPGGTQIGLALADNAKVAFAVVGGSGYYHRTIEVHFYTAPHVNPDGAKGHVYALCKLG